MRPIRGGTILTVLGLGLAACGGHETPKAAEPAAGPAKDVRTAEVVRSGGAGEVAVPGAVQARKRAALVRPHAGLGHRAAVPGGRVGPGGRGRRPPRRRGAPRGAGRRGSGRRTRPRPTSSARRRCSRRARPRRRELEQVTAAASGGAGPAHRGEGRPLLRGAARPLRGPRGRAPRQRRRRREPGHAPHRDRGRGRPGAAGHRRVRGRGHAAARARRSRPLVDGQPEPARRPRSPPSRRPGTRRPTASR